MRLESKIAVGIGILAIIGGVWYLSSPEKNDRSTDISPVAVDRHAARGAKPQDQASEGDHLTAPAGQSRASRQNTGHSASPSPRRLRDRQDPLPRPKPLETIAPPVTGRALERTGLAGDSWQSDREDLRPEGPRQVDQEVSRSDENTPVEPPGIGRVTPRAPAATHHVATRPAAAPRPRTLRPRTVAAPPVARSPAEQPTPEPMKVHVVQAGDTFSSLAVRHLGHAKYAAAIAQANPGKDPRRLLVGSKLNIPAVPPDRSTTGLPGRKPIVSDEQLPPIHPDRAYTVRPGEAWYDLAKRFLGEGSRWPELYELNRERVSNRGPHLLRAGTVIELPPTVATAETPRR